MSVLAIGPSVVNPEVRNCLLNSGVVLEALTNRLPLFQRHDLPIPFDTFWLNNDATTTFDLLVSMRTIL